MKYLLIFIAFLISCQQGNVKLFSKKGTETVSLKAKDTLKIEPLRTGFCNGKVVIYSYNNYKPDWIDLPSGEDTYTVKKVNIYMDTRAKSNPKYQYKNWCGFAEEETPYYKLVYTSGESDSLMIDHPMVASFKHYGKRFLVFIPKYTACDACNPEDDKEGYFLYTPSVFYIDTIKLEVVKLKYNRRLKMHPINGNHTIIEDLTTHRNTVWDRDFRISLKRKEFAFGKLYKDVHDRVEKRNIEAHRYDHIND